MHERRRATRSPKHDDEEEEEIEKKVDIVKHRKLTTTKVHWINQGCWIKKKTTTVNLWKHIKITYQRLIKLAP